jgi:hypothetical protein
MRTRNLMVAIALVGAGVAIGWMSAPGGAAAADGALTAQDYAEIEQLYARYNQGVDLRNAEMWLSVFAEDGIFQFRDEKYVGQAELAEYRARTFARTAGGPDIRHWNGSIVLTPTAEGAEGRAYWIMLDVSSPVPTEVASGHYDDVFVKTPAGWRIKVRTGYSDPRPAVGQ